MSTVQGIGWDSGVLKIWSMAPLNLSKLPQALQSTQGDA